MSKQGRNWISYLEKQKSTGQDRSWLIFLVEHPLGLSVISTKKGEFDSWRSLSGGSQIFWGVPRYNVAFNFYVLLVLEFLKAIHIHKLDSYESLWYTLVWIHNQFFSIRKKIILYKPSILRGQIYFNDSLNVTDWVLLIQRKKDPNKFSGLALQSTN